MPTNYLIQPADTEAAVSACYSVMKELRPHLTEERYREQVRRQQSQGYRLVYAGSGELVRAVAGYRVLENLAWGRFLYVDDLVTCWADQGGGLGSALFDWLLAEARREGCGQFHLDSGVQRFGAHRFYLHKGMDITAHHFAMSL
jgi:GNAT superfamily N-acetyltransferase